MREILIKKEKKSSFCVILTGGFFIQMLSWYIVSDWYCNWLYGKLFCFCASVALVILIDPFVII